MKTIIFITNNEDNVWFTTIETFLFSRSLDPAIGVMTGAHQAVFFATTIGHHRDILGTSSRLCTMLRIVNDC